MGGIESCNSERGAHHGAQRARPQQRNHITHAIELWVKIEAFQQEGGSECRECVSYTDPESGDVGDGAKEVCEESAGKDRRPYAITEDQNASDGNACGRPYGRDVDIGERDGQSQAAGYEVSQTNQNQLR